MLEEARKDHYAYRAINVKRSLETANAALRGLA